MKVIEIKSKKQNNGLWSIPLNCCSIEGYKPFQDKNELLFSSLIIAIDELHNKSFYIEVFPKKNGFRIKVDNFGTCFVKFDRYEIIDNKLYEFDDQNEHNMFIRKQKLKKLNEI